MRPKPNPHDQDTIDLLRTAEHHIAGLCKCPERMSDGPSSPECLRALEVACAAAQDEVLEALGRARHDVWLTSMVHSLAKAVERLEAKGRRRKKKS